MAAQTPETKAPAALGARAAPAEAVPMTMIQALRSGLDVAMGRDDTVIVYGQDVGYFGGVFRVTEGLQAKYSHSARVPFARLKVKLKDEIISFRHPQASPHSSGCRCPRWPRSGSAASIPAGAAMPRRPS